MIGSKPSVRMRRSIVPLAAASSEEEKISMAYDVAVVGGGPAGASAALFVAKAGKKTLLIDADKGMSRRSMVYNFYGVPEIRGPGMVDTGHQQAAHFVAELIKAAVMDVKKTENGQPSSRRDYRRRRPGGHQCDRQINGARWVD